MKIKNAKSCNFSSYKTLQIGWYFFKSTPLIFAFQPLGNGILGYLEAINFVLEYKEEFLGISPVTKFTPVGLIFIGVKISNHL